MRVFRRKTICFLAMMTMVVSQVHVTMTAAVLPNGRPFYTTCYNNRSLVIQQNISDNKDLIIVGNLQLSANCPQYKQHFQINAMDTMINAACMDTREDAFLIEVQTHHAQLTNSTALYLVGGKTSTVYRVTCDADPGVGSVTVKLDNAKASTVKPSASALVLPALKMAFYNTAPTTSLTSNKIVSQVHIGQEVNLVIYNDRSGGLQSYKLIPTYCKAYPEKDTTLKETILEWDGTKCVYESDIIGMFNVSYLADTDVAWTKLNAFNFETKPDSAVMIECHVTLCPQTSSSISQGFCKLKEGNPGYCVKAVTGKGYTHRKRDVGMDAEAASLIVRAKLQILDAYMMYSNVDNSTGAI